MGPPYQHSSNCWRPASCDPISTAKYGYPLGEIAREESRAYAIERRTAALMTQDGGFSPADDANFSEAIGELVTDSKYAGRVALILERVGKALAPNAVDVDAQYQMIGLHLVGFLKDYWMKYASNQAETEIDDSCPACFGAGCRLCYTPERND